MPTCIARLRQSWEKELQGSRLREQVRDALAEALLEPRPGGPRVKTAVTVAHEALRALRREARTQPGRLWRLTVNPDVAAALAGGATAALRALEQRFGRAVAIEADPGLDRVRFQIAPI